MARWQSDSRTRLEQAAYELFLERGYEATTVVDIALRAGVTERTFFRHYADKREVLFGGGEALGELMACAVAEMPPETSAMEATRAAIDAMARVFHGRREASRVRHGIVQSHRDLRERAAVKRTTLAAKLGAALRQRGVPDVQAALASEAGIGVFYVAFDRWLASDARELAEIAQRAFLELRDLAAR